MSEFSDGYYLRTADPAEAVKLLKRVRRYGLVLPPTGDYVPFLADGVLDSQGTDDVVIEASTGLLIRCFYGEDEGIALTVYDSGRKAIELNVQRRGPSDNDIEVALAETERLGLVSGDRIGLLRNLLEEASKATHFDPCAARERFERALDLQLLRWTRCEDLAERSPKALAEDHPDGQFVLKSRRGKAAKEAEPEPNEWCPQPGFSAFMYLPVPEGDVDEALLQRHVDHWVETGDWDDDRQEGFWLYNAYQKALPSKLGFLADRLQNLALVFEGWDEYHAQLRRTLRGILAVSDPSFDWEPYLERRKGTTRL